jgi:hypothetical protein
VFSSEPATFSARSRPPCNLQKNHHGKNNLIHLLYKTHKEKSRSNYLNRWPPRRKMMPLYRKMQLLYFICPSACLYRVGISHILNSQLVFSTWFFKSTIFFQIWFLIWFFFFL